MQPDTFSGWEGEIQVRYNDYYSEIRKLKALKGTTETTLDVIIQALSKSSSWPNGPKHEIK